MAACVIAVAEIYTQFESPELLSETPAEKQSLLMSSFFSMR